MPRPTASSYLPKPLDKDGFNPNCTIPYGCNIHTIQSVMTEFLEFLTFINTQLDRKKLPSLESMLMPANFSSVVGEFMAVGIPKYCPTIVKNQYHNGHPDLIPIGKFPNNAHRHCTEGIEIKGSRYLRRWQGHNPESCWLMVFAFNSSRPIDVVKGVAPFGLEFLMVVGAQLEKDDWSFSGRSGTSRRTITASVTESGYKKMMKNWVYKCRRLRNI